MNKTVLLLVVCAALTQGCVGIGVGWTKTKSQQNPVVVHPARLDRQGPGVLETNVTVCTTTWLERSWGKPDSIERTGPGGVDEVWTYKSDLIWNGAILFVLIPIPLEVPVGREWVKFVVRDGRVIEKKERSTESAGGIVGYSIGPCGITSFGVHSLKD